MGKRYVYLTCCVDSTADKINALVASAVRVSYATFVRHCDPYECEVLRTYERHPRRGLTLKNDFMVHFFRGTYNGVPCYVVDHSRIEYIWVRKEDADKLRRQGEANRYARSQATEGVPQRRYYPLHLAGLARSWLAEGGGDPAAGESGRGDPGWAEPW